MASARTSDHHPIPMQATRIGLALTTFALPLVFPWALALGDIHSKSPNLRRTRGLCASVSPPSSHFHSGCTRCRGRAAVLLPTSAESNHQQVGCRLHHCLAFS